jgi:methylmalonyl-CoA/ethylmalonyl-CoA epimerase
MGKLRHIALSVPDPWEAAIFYMEAFGMKKVGETDSELARGVYLSDGVINLALLNYKNDEVAGKDRGVKFVGIHHMGFWVDDIKEAQAAVTEAGGKYWMGEVAEKGNIFYEVKYRDPNGIVLDLTANGWGGASKEGGTKDLADTPKLRNPSLVADRSAIGQD